MLRRDLAPGLDRLLRRAGCAHRMTRRPPLRSRAAAAVGFYSRAISPALPPRCRFYPTCSAYAAEAIARHGAGRGSWLALRRLVKCAPWHPGGVDLVPGPGIPRTGREHGHSSSTAARHSPAPRPTTAVPPSHPAGLAPAAQEESSVA